MDEIEAVAALVAAAVQPSIECAALLSLDIVSPWASHRAGVRGLPDVAAPNNASGILPLMDGLAVKHPTRSPTSRGILPWLAFHALAVPLSSLPTVSLPLWVLDGALRDGWVTRPPRGWPGVIGPDIVTFDGRLAAVAHLAGQRAKGRDVTEAVQVLARWCCGPTRALPVHGEDEHRPVEIAVNWTRPGPNEWLQRSDNIASADPVAAILLDNPPCPEGWVPPRATDEQQAAQAARERILAQGRADDEIWRQRA